MSAQPQDVPVAGMDRPQLYIDLLDDYPEVVYLELLNAFRDHVTARLIRMRKDAGLSREDLGNMLGLDPDMVRMLEEGGRFSIKQVFAWAWACGKIPAEMLFLDRNEALTAMQGVPIVDES